MWKYGSRAHILHLIRGLFSVRLFIEWEIAEDLEESSDCFMIIT